MNFIAFLIFQIPVFMSFPKFPKKHFLKHFLVYFYRFSPPGMFRNGKNHFADSEHSRKTAHKADRPLPTEALTISFAEIARRRQIARSASFVWVHSTPTAR